MMKQIDLKNWEEFEAQVVDLTSQRAVRKSETGNYISEYLFRGQSDSSWRLETTLERYYASRLPTLEEYYRVLCAMKPQVETFTGVSWTGVPSFQKYIEEIGTELLLPPGKFPAYEYFVYLRHHGFPSPLLDWTRSPYVAAYFAFRDVTSKAPTVSIYAYCEYTVGHKSGSSSKPEITGLGPNVRATDDISNSRVNIQFVPYTKMANTHMHLTKLLLLITTKIRISFGSSTYLPRRERKC